MISQAIFIVVFLVSGQPALVQSGTALTGTGWPWAWGSCSSPPYSGCARW